MKESEEARHEGHRFRTKGKAIARYHNKRFTKNTEYSGDQVFEGSFGGDIVDGDV